ncbi:SH3 domain-containing protein [Streptococcus suis]
MTKTSLTANQPRFSIRTYSLGATSVLLAYACLAAGPVATANTGTETSTNAGVATVQTTTSSSTGQGERQVSQSTGNQSSTNQTSTTTSIQSTPSSYQEKNPTGTTTSSTQVTTPSSSPASSQQTTPASQESQSQTKQTKTNQNQTNTSSASSSAISQKNTSQSQTRNSQSPTTNQARATSTSSNSLITGSIARGNDYPYTAIDAVDPWKLYTRQCTSFVAFRLSKVNGFEIPPAYGNADVWGSRARQEGYRVDMTPAVGAVAWWTSPMHVAWVSGIQGDMVEIEEYNYGTRYTYNRRLIHKNSVSGYIHFKDLAGSPVSQTSPTPTQTHTSGLANSGIYTFTQQAPIKNEAKQSSTTLDYYYAGESVRYDRVLTADGYQWISYVSYSGQRRYIPIKQVQTSPTPQQTNKNLPSSGTYTFSSKAIVRNNPSLSSPEITYYGAGSSVRYDRVVTSEGRTWISYISYSGARRYIAIP